LDKGEAGDGDVAKGPDAGAPEPDDNSINVDAPSPEPEAHGTTDDDRGKGAVIADVTFAPETTSAGGPAAIALIIAIISAALFVFFLIKRLRLR